MTFFNAWASWVDRRLTAYLAVGCTLVAIACGPNDASRDVHILIDTSGSIPEELRIRIRESALASFEKWSARATPGDRFTLWWLAPTRSAFPAAHRGWVMPHLKAPAHRSRLVIAKQLREQVHDALERLPAGVATTPLLESIYYIGSTQATSNSGSWRLDLFSDLHQESARWSSLQPTRGASAQTVASSMLKLSPLVEVPPREVRVYAWPGLIGREVNVEQFARDRAAFTRFFETWCPQASHDFIQLQ